MVGLKTLLVIMCILKNVFGANQRSQMMYRVIRLPDTEASTYLVNLWSSEKLRFNVIVTSNSIGKQPDVFLQTEMFVACLLSSIKCTSG